MIKVLFIAIIIFIGLVDYALVVACSHLEDREQYQRMKGKRDE